MPEVREDPAIRLLRIVAPACDGIAVVHRGDVLGVSQGRDRTMGTVAPSSVGFADCGKRHAVRTPSLATLIALAPRTRIAVRTIGISGAIHHDIDRPKRRDGVTRRRIVGRETGLQRHVCGGSYPLTPFITRR